MKDYLQTEYGIREDFLLDYKEDLIGKGLMINWHDGSKEYTVSFTGDNYRTFIYFIIWYDEFQETEWLYTRDETKVYNKAKPIIDKIIKHVIDKHLLENNHE